MIASSGRDEDEVSSSPRAPRGKGRRRGRGRRETKWSGDEGVPRPSPPARQPASPPTKAAAARRRPWSSVTAGRERHGGQTGSVRLPRAASRRVGGAVSYLMKSGITSAIESGDDELCAARGRAELEQKLWLWAWTGLSLARVRTSTPGPKGYAGSYCSEPRSGATMRRDSRGRR